VIRELLGERALPLGETRSRLEEIVLELCRDHGLPLPATNVPLLGYEVDFLWADARLVVEADGGSHLSRRQRDRDNERDAVLARAGYLVRRYSWAALSDRAAVAAEIAAILGERLRTEVPQSRTLARTARMSSP
jgi:very-short-patch-repair endonuclease